MTPYSWMVVTGAGVDQPGAVLLSTLEVLVGRLQPVAAQDETVRAALPRLVETIRLALAQRAAFSRLPAESAAVALYDATQLNELLLAGPSSAGSPVVGTMLERVIDDAERLIVTALAEVDVVRMDIRHSADQEAVSDARLDQLATQYGADAARERRKSASSWLLSLAALTGAVASAYWAVQVARDAITDAWPGVVAPVIVCCTAALVGLLLMRVAALRDRASREYVRLQRGLTGVGAYLAPLPPQVRHLMRVTMAQTLFPRLLDDNDPLRAPIWPDSSVILESLQDSDSASDPESESPAEPGSES